MRSSANTGQQCEERCFTGFAAAYLLRAARMMLRRSAEWLPRARVTVLADATHHALPHLRPAELNGRLTDFLNGG